MKPKRGGRKKRGAARSNITMTYDNVIETTRAPEERGWEEFKEYMEFMEYVE